MAKFVGRRGELLIAKETTRGTATVTNGLAIPRSTISFDDKVETAREDEGLGKIADSDALFVVNRQAEGEFESALTDKNLPLVLTSLLGASPVTTGGPTYSHAFTLSNSNQHQSLSVLYQDPTETRLYPLAVVDSLKMTVSTNAIVMFTVGLKSRYGRDWAPQTLNFTAVGNKWLHQHLIFKLADTVGGLSGATAINLKELELTISTNTVFDHEIGTAEPADVLNQQFAVEGTLTLSKEDATYRNYMLDGTYKAADITLQGSATSKLQLQLPRVDFTEWEQDRELNSIVGQTIQFKGNYDMANALDIISTCIVTSTFAGTSY